MNHWMYLLPALVGVSFLSVGLFLQGRAYAPRNWLDRFVSVGAVFFASPLATFGTEHFVIPRDIARIVPPWLPAREAVAYLVGVALILAGLSFTFRRCERLAALLTGCMFLGFVGMIHVPGMVTHPGNRDFVIDAARDSAFGACAFALYLQLADHDKEDEMGRQLLRVSRIWTAFVVLVFAVLQISHPECSPGVPSLRVTPSWIPLPLFVGYFSGVLLAVCGVAILSGRFARIGAATAAAWMLLLTVFLYSIDIFLLPAQQWLEGVNYIFDTMLFGGALLLLAQCLPAPTQS